MLLATTRVEDVDRFVSDPTVPPVMKNAGHKSKPQSVQLAGRCDA